MGMAKAGSRYPEFIYYFQSLYLYFDRSLERLEYFCVHELGLPQDCWDNLPKSIITNV